MSNATLKNISNTIETLNLETNGVDYEYNAKLYENIIVTIAEELAIDDKTISKADILKMIDEMLPKLGA